MSNSSPRYLGMDLGGTKSAAVLMDSEGNTLARAEGRGVAWLDDPAGSAEALTSAVDAVLGATGTTTQTVAAACVGSAGADRRSVAQLIEDALATRLPGARLHVTTDVALGLPAAGLESGVVVVAGTGSIAWGRNEAGTTARAGGWGYLLGDEGSGYDVGRQALQAALIASDGRGEGTLLTSRLVRHLQLRTVAEAVEWVHQAPDTRRAVAALAPLVVDVADMGDQVAAGILSRAGIELGRAAAAVIRRLGLSRHEVMLVPLGGLFAAGDLIQAPLLRVAGREAAVTLCAPKMEPTLAAAQVAMRSSATT